MRWALALAGLVLMVTMAAGTAGAQDAASRLPITFGEEVQGTITNEAFFDHWTFDARAGDVLQITMTGFDGLAPLVGILNSVETLQAASTEGAVNGAISLRYDVPEDGSYLIVATRAGTQNGTTTGGYRLRVDNLNPEPADTPSSADNPLIPFDCNGSSATPILTIEFARDDYDAIAYSIRVYGFEGAQPVVRVQSGQVEVCDTTPVDALGDQVTFPGEATLTLTEADLATTVQHVITEEGIDPLGIRVTFANLNGNAGRFAAVIGGFRIEPGTDIDRYRFQLAPERIDAGRGVLFYAVGINNRLDPTVLWDGGHCDDAGRRGCEDVPLINRAGIRLNNGVAVIGDRFDAGAQISMPGDNEYQVLSFEGTTNGEYALLLFG